MRQRPSIAMRYGQQMPFYRRLFVLNGCLLPVIFLSKCAPSLVSMDVHRQHSAARRCNGDHMSSAMADCIGDGCGSSREREGCYGCSVLCQRLRHLAVFSDAFGYADYGTSTHRLGVKPAARQAIPEASAQIDVVVVKVVAGVVQTYAGLTIGAVTYPAIGAGDFL